MFLKRVSSMWLVKMSPRSQFPQFYVVMFPHSVLIIESWHKELFHYSSQYLQEKTNKKLINKEYVQVLLSNVLLYSPTSAVF